MSLLDGNHMDFSQSFRLHDRGFQIDFPNGWTVSVLTDSMYYADKRHAETAAWYSDAHNDRVWLDADEYATENQGGTHVNGYQTPRQVADFIQRVSKLRRLRPRHWLDTSYPE